MQWVKYYLVVFREYLLIVPYFLTCLAINLFGATLDTYNDVRADWKESQRLLRRKRPQ